jgi:hypothetical protein
MTTALGGQPTKFTKERREAIIKSIRLGVPYIIAAEANGLSERRLYEWIVIGQKNIDNGIDDDFAKFTQSLKENEQKKIIEQLEHVNNREERWQANAWILERRWWKHFSSNASVVEFEERLKKMEDARGIDNDESKGKS